MHHTESDFECMCSPYFSAIEIEDPECRVDIDCPPQMTCMRETCRNPCIVTNPCTSSQQCVVTDTLTSFRSVACICPEGTLAGYGGTCESGKICSNYSNLVDSKNLLIKFYS